jgi:hypothetical protein
MASDLDGMIATLRRCEVLKESEVKALCAKAMEVRTLTLNPNPIPKTLYPKP